MDKEKELKQVAVLITREPEYFRGYATDHHLTVIEITDGLIVVGWSGIINRMITWFSGEIEFQRIRKEIG